jgi:uncharacterized membrane protein
MKKAVAILAMGWTLCAVPVHAAATFEYLFDGGYARDVSWDGNVVVGFTAVGSSATPFRWTQATGLVDLGRRMLFGAGGEPSVSADGSKVACGIGSLDSTYTTWGLWTQATGWQELMPPTPPSGGTLDGSYGSTWNMSDDGSTVVGLYWRPGVGNRAHAAKWTAAGGAVDLGFAPSGIGSRANGVNHNGTVIGGWIEQGTGPWLPTVWANGTNTMLTEYIEEGGSPVGAGEVRAVSPDGNVLLGYCIQSGSHQRAAAMWKRVNGVWQPTQFLGWVDGTEPVYGINIAQASNADGSMVVGYCSFDGSPFNPTGWVWTQAMGLKDVNEFLALNGVFVDPNFTIKNMTAMTPDGTKLFGYGQMVVPPYTYRSFKITLPATADAPVTAPVARLELSVPRPNPSRGAIRLELALPSESDVDLAIFDAAGRRVASLLQGNVPAGPHSVTWDGRDSGGSMAAAGLYFARAVTPHGSASQRLVRVQ